MLLNLYLLRLGYGPELIGSANATIAIAFAAFSLPAGLLGRRFGIRRMMIVGSALSIIGFTLLPMTELVPPGLKVGWILITRFPSAFGMALYFVNVTPFLIADTSKEERSHAFSVQAALMPLSGFVGSLVGGFLPGLFANVLGVTLADPAPYRYPLLIAALLLLPVVPVLAATREVEVKEVKETATEKIPLPFALITLFSLFVLFRGSGEAIVRTFFNVYLDDALQVSPARIGVLLAFGQLLAVPAALSMPILVARYSRNRTVLLGSLGIPLGLLPIALIPHWGAAGFSLVAITALASVVRSAFLVYSMEVVPKEWMAATSGAVTMAMGLSYSITSFVGGYLIPVLGYRSLYLMGAALTVVAPLLFLIYLRIPPRWFRL